MARDDVLRTTEGYIAEKRRRGLRLFPRRLYVEHALDFDDLILQTVALLELFLRLRERLPDTLQYVP
jgi:hypothetical protein